EVLQARPFMLKTACAAFQMFQKHLHNGAYNSGERTRLACWRWRPCHRELCLGSVIRAFSACYEGQLNSWGGCPRLE
ncbi:MAG: hypothetical protein DME90_00505, partial [Verrucomicrobia bacterium]